MKPEEFEVYVIPPNFMEGGTLFGGLLKTRNTIEAVILGLAVGVPVLHLPFSLTVRVVILCLTALPLVLLALIGVSGMSLSAFIRLFFCFLHNRRILSRDGTQGGKNGKTLLPSWAQQRKSDCEAEDPPLPKSRSRFSVDLKQRSVTQFKTFLQEEEAVQPLNALADYIPNQRIHYEEKGGYLMPKKKTIPPPDDFSSEFMETESAKELSEQQVEAAVSDNTETPLAGPPEVDLGSGDVSGTADVEENELDAENTADAAETVPVSDEKAEDPEYDSILQELNSSTPTPLDSSGENALDALLLEGNVENAPPAEDETESADGEAAPQPAAPPAPAGRRDSYILTVDAKDRIETEEERREVIWHEIKTSHIAGRILTGTLDGVEQTPSGRTIVVVDYKGYRIAIPLKEMMLYSGPVPYGAKYKPFMERMNSILATMLTAEIDFIVRGLDNTARSVVASRKAAMLRKRQTFYLDTNEDGVPMIYEGRVVQARVIGVAEKVLRVEVFGVECTIFARDLSAAWFGDAREYYSVGDRVLVRVLTIDRGDINHISITADIRSVSSAANQSNLDKCVLQGKYAGRVTDVRHGVVFIRLNNGVNAVAHTCYDRRMPGKKDDVSFAVTRLDEERGIAVGIITRIIKQNL